MYEQARKAIWEAINPHSGKRRIDEAFPPAIRQRTDNSGMTIEFKSGSIWRVVGSDNPDSLVGAPPAGIVFSEWALANPAAWAYLAPILAENGGWADFITTPRGRNHVKTMLDMARVSKDWFAEVLTIDDTQAVSRETVEQQRLEYHSIYGTDAGDALIEQEYWCSFEAAILGAYWGKEMVRAEQEGRITDVQPDEALKVNTAWDLGVDDSMAIWFWQAGAGTIRVVDYYEASGYGIEHYAKLIKAKAEERGYQRGTDYVPHDAKVREMTSSGKDGKAKQRIEVMIECGLKPRLITDHKVADGISAVRQILPRVWFDAERCKQGLECLRQYRAEWDDDRRVFRQIPLHDWSCVAGETLVITREGAKAISTLSQTGEVLTPCGWKQYHSPRITRRNAPLVEVAFKDGLKVRCTADHLFLTVNGWKFAELLQRGSEIQSSLTKLPNITKVVSTSHGRLSVTLREAAKLYTAEFGRMFSGLGQKKSTFITETATFLTTPLKILSACLSKSIFPLLGMNGPQRDSGLALMRRRGTTQPNGIKVMLAGLGIGEMLLEPKDGQNGGGSRESALTATRYLTALSERMGTNKNTAQTNVRLPIITSVKRLGETADVWCLTVDDGSWWSLANGAVVHNSHGADAFRSLAMAYRELAPVKGPEKGRILSVGPGNQVTLNDLWKLQPKRSRRI